MHRSYLKPIRALIDARMLKGAAHITGGGITDNTPRILPAGLAARVDVSTWTIPPIFEEAARDRKYSSRPTTGEPSTWAIGMILVVSKRNLGESPRGCSEQPGTRRSSRSARWSKSRGPRVVYVGGDR